MTTSTKIINAIEAIESVQPNTISLYLIKRRITEDKEKRFVPTLVKIEGEPVSIFHEIMINKLSGIKSDLEENEMRLMNFYDEAINPDDLSELKLSEILGFKEMINKIGRDDQVRSISNLQDEEKFHLYACEFQFDSELVIYFRHTSYKNLISKGNQFRNWFRYSNATFTRVEDDIFTFDEVVDCVYVKSLNSIIVLDKTNTEFMFGFHEYYSKFATKTLKELQDNGKIKITSEMLELENKVALSKRITNVAKAGRFNKTIESFQKCHDFFEAHEGEYREELTQIDIQGDLLNIDTDEKLETYAHLSNQDIVRDMMSEELFISFKKESMKRSNSSQ